MLIPKWVLIFIFQLPVSGFFAQKLLIYMKDANGSPYAPGWLADNKFPEGLCV